MNLKKKDDDFKKNDYYQIDLREGRDIKFIEFKVLELNNKNHIISLTNNGIRIFDLQNKKTITIFKYKKITYTEYYYITKDKKYLMACGNRGGITFWYFKSGKILKHIETNGFCVNTIFMFKNKKSFVCYFDCEIKILCFRTGKKIQTIFRSKMDYNICFQVTKDEKFIALRNFQFESISVFNIKSGRCVKRIDFFSRIKFDNIYFCLKFVSFDNKYLFYTTNKGVFIRCFETLRILKRIKVGNGQYFADISKDYKYLIVCCNNISIIKIDDGRVIKIIDLFTRNCFLTKDNKYLIVLEINIFHVWLWESLIKEEKTIK